MTKDEALKLALEALEKAAEDIEAWGSYASGYHQVKHGWENDIQAAHEAITAIKEALSGCQCPECQVKPHASDCAVHNEPAYPKGECNCGAQPEQEPVAWNGLDLDGMAEAFNRVIEEHHSRTNPFHDPVNRDAMIALRELRGCIAYMKRNTTPPQRKPLSDEEISEIAVKFQDGISPHDDTLRFARAIEAALRSKNT